MSILEEIGQNDKAYSSVIKKVKEGLDASLKMNRKESDVQAKKTIEDQKEYTNLKQQNENQERGLKEMKKQLTCYKNEIQGIKKMESYLTLENYQKLINEFNSLYDHYKGLKQVNKKIKLELK